ncbi:unnamed protein product [Cylindrotheca closterium]|uniref:Uncharacterized protein n=1 Tax=Cylindrotheca closterium TaxID=2856 RepID=A0AAD2G2H5_9STRA|nr:unnamed protein product [Cylindrotheca closterium]
MVDRTRVTLYQTESNLGNYQTTSISKLYALNNNILAGFESHYQNGLLEVAFYLGLKFADSALIQIPKHGYFYSSKHKNERSQSSTDSIRVTQLLQQIVALEPERLAKECHKVERLHYLAREQFERLDTYEKKRAAVERDLYHQQRKGGSHRGKASSLNKTPKHRKSRSRLSSDQDCMSSTLLACGDSFSSIFCPSVASSTSEAAMAIREEFTGKKKKEELNKSFPDAHKIRPEKGSSKSTRFPDGGKREGISSFPTNPGVSKRSFPSDAAIAQPGLFPASPAKPVLERKESDYIPPPPPEHHRTQSDLDLERALFLSGLQVLQDKKRAQNGGNFGQEDEVKLEILREELRDMPPVPVGPPGAKKRQASGVTTELFTNFMQQDFEQLYKKGRVRITQMSTYQGKNPLSTNGCAVIAPLMCIHHFVNESSIPDHGLPDRVVEEVLDDETPNLLPMIRRKLGLVDSAFLIPSDAHEALMQEDLLSEKQFRNVLGGNILDESHLIPLVEELSKIGEKKIGATFFFHEHVVSILQLRQDERTVWFDLIDTLPHEETLLRGPSKWASSRNHGDDSKISNDDSYRILSDFSDVDLAAGVVVDDVPDQEPAARIRCLDAEALRIALQWYACSVFSMEDATYIDTYQWDDNLADFDPRVFQAFIWSQA